MSQIYIRRARAQRRFSSVLVVLMMMMKMMKDELTLAWR